MATREPRVRARDLAAENEELRARLEEAEETLRAIRAGEVDALVVESPQGGQVFTLQGADHAYRTLIEQMNEGALSLTGEGMILYANQRFASMLNASLETVIGSAMQDWVSPEYQATLEALLQHSAHNEWREELTLCDAQGRQVPVYLSASRLSIDGAGNFIGVVATDLTERKRAEDALRLSEARFRNVFHNISIGKTLVDMDGKRLVNDALLAMFGYTEEEFSHKTWQELTYPEDLQPSEAALNAVRTGRLASARFDKRFIHKDGHVIWADVTVSLVRDADGKPQYILTSIYDITERKEAEAALNELKAHLERYIQMERLHLAQDLHDVPLQELYSIIYRLEDLRGKMQPQSAEVIGDVISDIKGALYSIRAIASELRPPTIARLGLEKAARSYLQGFREKHPEIRVDAELAHDEQMLPESTRTVLLRVLQESCANVVRHAEASGLRVCFTLDRQKARLEISDNGKGFPVPARWASLVRQGHYGLAGLRERVKAAGGTLKVMSVPGSSTTVSASLPYEPASRNRRKKKTARKKKS